MIELVLGAAVMCDKKTEFISNIFSLDQNSQAILKNHIETVMTRLSLMEQSNLDHSTGEGDDDNFKDQFQYQDEIRQLQAERDRLQNSVVKLQRDKEVMRTELDSNQLTIQNLQQQLKGVSTQSTDDNTGKSVTSLQSSLQVHILVILTDQLYIYIFYKHIIF